MNERIPKCAGHTDRRTIKYPLAVGKSSWHSTGLRAGASVIRSLSDQLKMMADGCEAKCGLHIERKKEREHDINAHPGRKN